MTLQLPIPLRQNIERIYRRIDTRADLCIPGCHDCCNEIDPEISYLEFAYLISDFSDKELKEIFSRSRIAIKGRKAETRDEIIHSKKGIIVLKNQNMRSGYCCQLLDEDGKCLAYERRPWGCRTYHRYALLGKCIQEPENIMTENNRARIDLFVGNRLLVPKEFRDVQNRISDWYKKLF